MPLSLSSRIALVLLALVGVLTGASSALAQSDHEPPAYRKTIDEALVELRAEHYAEARALFSEAHQLFPNARTLRGLGIAAFELRSYAESIDCLEQALASEVRPLDARLRGETEALLERAYRFVARIHLMLVPAETRVSLDGTPLSLQPGKPLVLEVGEHTLRFGAEGYTSEQRTISVKGREVETWEVTLRPATHVASPAEAAATLEAETHPLAQTDPRAPRRDRPLYKNAWLWTSVGVAAVITGAIVTAVLVMREDEPRVRDPVKTMHTPTGGILSTLTARSQRAY